ncbi:cardiolipin synthase [Bizionia paragorgiae]|uniref:Cardiolipin synthase n=1 Tax=Bizionia paragorgiae TaxID=283786 RepID=A0A1H3Y838_BIZPA|nr:cardiolipin synthase [Bizionia paragorgiae]MDX1270707.1 cardiolipin synthase [Bizionia paragorgiae]SEA07819.1 cardiolipin synthase [Bizionia paragorgiae]
MLELFQNNIWYVLIVINYLLAISAVTTLLFRNINPTKTLSYIIVLVFFPFFGLLVYYLFGQEYRKSKIFNRKNILNQSIVKKLNASLEQTKSQLDALEDDFLEDKIKLVKLLQKSDKAPLTKCNTVDILLNGETKFDRLLEDLKAAKHHIHIEYYIVRDDKIGSKVLNLLCEKALSGVKVRLSIDDVGSSITRKMKTKLKESGVEFYSFMPVLFPKFTGRMNYRNHRKIVIIDGAVGYIGGINISDAYVNYPESEDYWRDTHLRLEGEAIVTLQVQFLINWNFVSDSDVDISEDFFPNKPCKDEIAVQIAASGPDTDWANIMEVIFSAITSADDYIYLTTPYFIPNPQIITALQVASKSGIDVRLLIPDKSDSWTAKHATNAYLDSLFDAGIKVYRYQKGFIHAKTLVVDDVFSTIGTSNMDYRSFNINFEINAVVYNKKVSKELKAIFLKDLESAQVMNPEAWIKRPKSEKIKESICKLWAPLL